MRVGKVVSPCVEYFSAEFRVYFCCCWFVVAVVVLCELRMKEKLCVKAGWVFCMRTIR